MHLWRRPAPTARAARHTSTRSGAGDCDGARFRTAARTSISEEQRIERRNRALSKEIIEIDTMFYETSEKDPAQRYSMLERKRDDLVRGVVLQLHTSIEDLLNIWLKSHLLGVPVDMRNVQARRWRIAGRAVDDILKAGAQLDSTLSCGYCLHFA
jgi:hypothetical protein